MGIAPYYSMPAFPDAPRFSLFFIFQFIHYSIMNDIDQITSALTKFRDDRDWTQFHDSKNLATAISIEAAELNELFLWKNISDSEQVDRGRIQEELADIFAYSFLLAEKHGFDVREIVLQKIRKNSEKYPTEKARGVSDKYDQL